MSHDQVRLNAVVDRSPINEGKYGDQMKPGFFWNGSVCDWLGGLSGDRQLLLGLGEGAKPTRDSTGTNILTSQPQRAEVFLHMKISIHYVPLPVRHAYIQEQSNS